MNSGIEKDVDESGKEQSSRGFLAVSIICTIALILCLIFFISALSNFNTGNSPKIKNVKQTGATSSSVLISWDCLGNADEYAIKCIDTNGNVMTDLTTDIQFAAVRALQPDSVYTVEVYAVDEGKQGSLSSVSCSTKPFCKVENITVNKVGRTYVDISWEYSGIDNGFTAVAYAVDTDGKRHLTSEKIKISSGESSHCVIKGLLPEMNYTVAVMPDTTYKEICKANFQTGSYNESYKRFNIMRFVICPASSNNPEKVAKLRSIKPNEPYKTSLIISGSASKDDKSEIGLYITNSEGQLVSETKHSDIYTNPNGIEAFRQRAFLLSFTSPDKDGQYKLYLTIDGEMAESYAFEVDKKNISM